MLNYDITESIKDINNVATCRDSVTVGKKGKDVSIKQFSTQALSFIILYEEICRVGLYSELYCIVPTFFSYFCHSAIPAFLMIVAVVRSFRLFFLSILNSQLPSNAARRISLHCQC